jgi:hypothetical protein
MFNTPLGMRPPFDSEKLIIQVGGYKLFKHISSSKKDKGVILTPVKESSAFHGLNAPSQIFLLHQTLSMYLDTVANYAMSQFNNSALECVYSCLLNEVCLEITTGKKIEIRQYIHYAMMEFESRDVARKISPSHTVLKDWISIIDNLAAKSVYEQNFAKAFDTGYLPELDPELDQLAVASAENYLEQFASFIRN